MVVELIEYAHDAMVSKSIMKRATEAIDAMYIARAEGLNEKTSPFDPYAQIIEGSANMVIKVKSTMLETGQEIIIPSHKPSHIKPNGRFKMIRTVIKSDIDDI